jgi:hypothetical protein
LGPSFHVPENQIELQHNFGRTISALFGAMFMRQRGTIGSDSEYTAVLDDHALAADACVALQTKLAAEHKVEVAARRRAETAAANAAAGAAVRRRPPRPPTAAAAAAAAAAMPAAQEETRSQARNRRLADLCRASGARRETYLEGNETRDALMLRVQTRLQYLETFQKDPESDIPLLFLQQALDELDEDDRKMDV